MSYSFTASVLAPALALAFALGATSPALAQPTEGALPPWATEPAAADHTKDIPSDEALLRQHLAGGDSAPAGNVTAAQRARATAAAVGASGAAVAPQGAAEASGNSIANAVKDLVKPLHQQLSNSDVVKAVREIDGTVSGRGQADAAAARPGYGQSGGGATGASPVNRKPDGTAAALLWQQFLEDALPWVVGVGALGVFSYGGYIWLELIKQKNLKIGEKRRAARRTESAGRHFDKESGHHSRKEPSKHSERRSERPSASRNQ